MVIVKSANSTHILTNKSVVKGIEEWRMTTFPNKSIFNWASEVSPILGCSIEISRDIIYVCLGLSMGKQYKKIIC